MKRSTSIILNGLCILTLLLIGISSESYANWYSASNNGCLVWYKVPAEDDPDINFTVNTITWCGDCFYGLAQGAGVLTANTTSDGDTFDNLYETFMLNGKMNGYTVVYGRTSKMEVEYRDGSRNGLGVVLYMEDETEWSYQGEWENGSESGLGVRQIINGDFHDFRYEGQFKEGNFDGLGVSYPDNESRYEGQWENGVTNGFGVSYWEGDSSGDRYEGEWINGNWHGLGIFYNTSGDWSGSRYEGKFSDGSFNGLGIYYVTLGFRYEGEWGNGENHGYGVFYHSDGTIEQGEWNSNSLVNTSEDAILLAQEKAAGAVTLTAEAQSVAATAVEAASSATAIAIEAKAKAEESLEVAALAREQASISQEACNQLTDALSSTFGIFVSNTPGNISLGIRAPQNAEEAYLYLELTQLPYEYGWNDQFPSFYYSMDSSSFSLTKTPILTNSYPVSIYNFDTFFVFPLAIGEIELAKGFYKFKAYLADENGEILYGPSEAVFNNDCVDGTCNDFLKNCELNQEFRETISACSIVVD